MATVEPKRRALAGFLEGVVGVAPEWSPAKASIPQVIDIVMKAGIQEAVDLSFLDENELTSMFGDETQLMVARLGGQAAMGLRDGWVQNAVSTRVLMQPQPDLDLAPRREFLPASTSVGVRAETALVSLALSSAGGSRVEDTIPQTSTFEELEQKSFRRFFQRAQDFFLENMRSSPRGEEIIQEGGAIREGDEPVLWRGFQGRSKSVQFCEQRLAEASRSLEGLRSMGLSPWSLTPWDTAKFLQVHAKGRKEKAIRLRCALRWLEYVSGAPFHADERLARDQCSFRKGEKTKAKHAKPPSENVIANFELQVVTAPTVQLRAFAGMLAFLAHTSHRGLDGIRSRGLKFSQTSLGGESLIKTTDTWTEFAIPRAGFSQADWLQSWLDILGMSGLPGVDYVVNGMSTDGCAWLPRPANTNDLENALRLLLQVEPTSMSADKAAGYSVHGLRSYYITALTQMRARCSDRERVGRWKANSEMPDKYDSIAGTAGLLTRKRVADAVPSGWRLALPN